MMFYYLSVVLYDFEKIVEFRHQKAYGIDVLSKYRKTCTHPGTGVKKSKSGILARL